jgi:(1->4)-alpha-D-glucan 1-alpha-D-glucosylmutase
MAEPGDALLALCRRLGVLPAFHDIWGHEHRATHESLVALLREFDIDAGSDEAIRVAEQRAEAAQSAEVLPPVVPIRAGEAGWSVRVRPAVPGQSVRWTLLDEGGGLHDGAFSWDELVAADFHPRMPVALPPGYHRLLVAEPARQALVIAAPAQCFRAPGLQGGARVWGPSIQLYGLRSECNWGIGDFGDLRTAIDQWAARGAGVIGLNPLHALFPHNPLHISPYSPSSRLMLNTLYLDVEAIADFRECEAARRLVASPAFQQRLAALRASETVDYAGVAAAKSEVLQLLHASFVARHLQGRSARGGAFRRFEQARGAALRQHATFEALQAHFHARDASVWGWPVWPEAYRSPDSPAVAAFAAEHADEIGFFAYLQWQADRQLAAAHERCATRGMAVGLYLDLAVSVDRAGSDAWSHAPLYAAGASVGAPPDEVNPNGQGWGLPPLRPDRLRASGHALFIETLRACMRHADALRIDHVMALMRLFWIPPGYTPSEGAYVLYPLAELIAIVALESERQRCVVIGEDLGTVDAAMREAMRACEMLSYRLLYFERTHDGGFTPGADYPRHALVAVSTHDLPTLAGWWSGHDLKVRQALGLYATQAVAEQQRSAREHDRTRLLQALQGAGLLPAGAAAPAKLTPELCEAVHAYAAGSAAELMLVQLEDALRLEDQANLPGTVDEHPNWRRKLPLTLEAQAQAHDEAVASLARRLAEIRPRLMERPAVRHEAVIPRATYRLQFHRGFGFDDAVRTLPYLKRLGISHVYCSPVLRARAGSTHGYDVVAHDEINPELGGREGFDRFCAALQAHGMGQLLDMVPNHMGVLGADNAWWMDVLENGPASAYARHFDIDWHPVNRELEGKVLVPVLGDHYGAVLDRGELRLSLEPAGCSLVLRYHEHRFPLGLRSYARVLAQAATLAPGADDRAALARLEAQAESAQERAPLKARLCTLLAEQLGARMALDATVEALNTPAQRDALHALHEQQAYRLAFWRVAADEINYRRFFDINELAALRMEDPAVFEATQHFALELTAAGKVDGLRIDHPDGLQDPAQYFARLQQGHARRAGLRADNPQPGLYVVAEKIAAPHEDVPTEWPIHGTTGYRFAMVVNGVLVDHTAADAFSEIWQRFSGETADFAELAYQGKRAVTQEALASELTLLATALMRIARADRRTRDYTFNSLRSALAEIAACMPVYRTYVVERPSAQDERYIDWAIAQARRRSTLADLSIFDFTKACMRNQAFHADSPVQPEALRQFALRFQQFCAPVAAKGVEDTAFYRYHRLVSLNEVGGDPSVFGITPRAFHGASSDRAERWPHTIVATSTHDNKRSEDVRCRIDVLSEMPQDWAAALERWRGLSANLRAADAAGQPSAADEYLLYQTLLGTLPAEGLADDSIGPYRERIQAYMLKAARESKRHTSWTRPDEAYEAALAGFVHGVLARARPNPLLSDLQAMASTLAWFGALNSLSMTLLKLAAPGVPDLYQGNELIDLSLVDPDNRRPVDYALRERLLWELEALADKPALDEAVLQLARQPLDGRAKLWVIWRLLALHEREPEFFCHGRYVALATRGEKCDHVLAHARQHGEHTLVVVAGRLFFRLLGEAGRLPLGDAVWGDTAVELAETLGLPEGARFLDLLTGRTLTVGANQLSLGTLFSHCPAAALWRLDDNPNTNA